MAAPSKRPTSSSKASSVWSSPWSKDNYLMLGVGVVVIVVGFVLLSMGMEKWDNPLSVSVAPVVLVIGYCVIIPLAIMRLRSGSSASNNGE
jgi:ATP/ADP translocase